MEIMFNDMMDEKRLIIEGINAWNDNFRSMLLRNDTILYCWLFWHFFPSTCRIIENIIQFRVKIKSIL
jgi:hypothetical protein